MKDFFDTWKFKILVGIAVFLVGIMAYAGANGRLTAAPQELLSVAAAPFQKVAAVVSGGVASLWEKYTSIDDVMAENETLKAENAELRQQMVDYDRVKAENQAYKALESIQSQRPEMSYLSSFVIGRDPLDSFYGFTLDRGTLDGVAVNDAVVSDQGYLLGMVVEAEPSWTPCSLTTSSFWQAASPRAFPRAPTSGCWQGWRATACEPWWMPPRICWSTSSPITPS